MANVMLKTLLPLFMAGLVHSAHAENWPAWRGPTGQGISTEKNLPTKWSKTENVRWRIDLPAPGNSTPIVWNDRIFVTQSIPSEKQRAVICFNRPHGKLLWTSGPTYNKEELTHETNYGSSSSPVTDGERVIAFFGSAGLFLLRLPRQ